jgi:hypothetical protein
VTSNTPCANSVQRPRYSVHGIWSPVYTFRNHEGVAKVLYTPQHSQNLDAYYIIWDTNQSCLEKPNLFSSSFLYPSSLPCGNSVVLSHHDRLYLEYFPNTSLVKVLGKAYTWSNFRYICQNKALEDPAVMYAVIALSASELYQSLSPVQAQDESRVYYSLALQRIADTVGSLTCDTNKIEAVLSALFLIIVYESRHGSYNSRVTTHTQNLVSCLTVCFRSVEPGSNGCNDLTSCPAFTPFCAQVLLWILYVENIVSLFLAATDQHQLYRVKLHLWKYLIWTDGSLLYVHRGIPAA